MLSSTGPGYDSWTSMITGADLGSKIPSLVKTYTNRALVVDHENWYISTPSGAWCDELSAGMVALTRSAIKVDELRALSKNNRLSTAQTKQLQTNLEFDGLNDQAEGATRCRRYWSTRYRFFFESVVVGLAQGA
ncbi:hypothetical protein MRB53_039787 [Persea americana]|nr:hypothetical protein MRB53_039787 [Persea americana]